MSAFTRFSAFSHSGLSLKSFCRPNAVSTAASDRPADTAGPLTIRPPATQHPRARLAALSTTCSESRILKPPPIRFTVIWFMNRRYGSPFA